MKIIAGKSNKEMNFTALKTLNFKSSLQEHSASKECEVSERVTSNKPETTTCNKEASILLSIKHVYNHYWQNEGQKVF